MNLAELNYADVLRVAANMREWDKKEIYATMWSDDPMDLAEKTMVTAGAFSWIAGTDRPIACFGAVNPWPGVWTAWMFATDELPKVGLGLSRFVRNNIIPTLRKSGSHRIHAYSMVGHTDAHDWLHLLGAEIETTHRGFGRNGEDFHVFVVR
ncbi:protein of unknown function [Magnetospirillum sp. XM-1]|uniref:hypothetical protein n=1 Tax=Magnetospirillum sp. XM-1 TaxID=1663591 RepID=UPI00073DCA69|nr:hypothetical protein [Magnetospirillum sp. XM-1]CUW38786.1 protein of unknown function [Magnetospirillum sp. XM-1]